MASLLLYDVYIVVRMMATKIASPFSVSPLPSIARSLDWEGSILRKKVTSSTIYPSANLKPDYWLLTGVPKQFKNDQHQPG